MTVLNPSMGSGRAARSESVRTVIEAGAVAVASAILTVYTYWLVQTRPTPTVKGYMGNVDQGDYLAIAKILASGHLPMGPTQYTYGLGYPAVAVVPIWFGAKLDPFIVPSTILFGFAMAFTLVAARRLIGRTGSWVVVTLLLVASPLLALTAIPWSSTVTLFCFTFALMVATQKRIALPWFAILGALSAWAFAARFVDVIPVLAVSLIALTRAPKGRWWIGLILGGVVLSLGVGFILWTQWKSLGSPFITPYAYHVRSNTGIDDQSLNQYHLGRVLPDFWGTFISANSGTIGPGPVNVQVHNPPLLQASPYLVLAPLGFIVAMIRAKGSRALYVVVAVATIVVGVTYLAFIAGSAWDLQYSNQRYWAPSYPYWTILAVGGAQWLVNLGRRDRGEGKTPRSAPAAAAPDWPSEAVEPESDDMASSQVPVQDQLTTTSAP